MRFSFLLSFAWPSGRICSRLLSAHTGDVDKSESKFMNGSFNALIGDCRVLQPEDRSNFFKALGVRGPDGLGAARFLRGGELQEFYDRFFRARFS